jgi:hypothetical protein
MEGDWDQSERQGRRDRKFDAAVVIHPVTEEVAQYAYDIYGPESGFEYFPIYSPVIPTLYAVGENDFVTPADLIKPNYERA